MGVPALEREIYSEADAAKILRVPKSTLHWWLEGGSRSGKKYRPVLRPEPTGSTTLSWGEFIEAGLLRQYRRDHAVALSELRVVINHLRDQLGIPYPLAHQRLWVGEGRRLLLEVQENVGLNGELWLMAVTSGQVVMPTAAGGAFIARVQWDDDVPTAWKPVEDSPVLCSPDLRFGRPSIRGISTEAIVEHLVNGEDEAEVARQFKVSVEDVAWARTFESAA